MATLWKWPGATAALVAVAVLAGGVYLLGAMLHPPTDPHAKAWFIDEKDGNTVLNPADAFAGPATAMPPLLNKDGKPTIVRAIFVTCGTYEQRQLAYLEKYTPEAQQAFEEVRQGKAPSDTFLRCTQLGHIVRTPEPGSEWVQVKSQEALDLMTRIRCDGRLPRYCPPRD